FAFCTVPGTQYLIHPTPRYYGPTLMSQVFPLPMSPVLNAAVVAPRKVPFDEAIEDDEQIPTAHLANAQLGQPDLAIIPGVGQHGVGIPADDGLERQLDGQVEMMGEDWLHAGDHRPTIAFERIGNVIGLQSEQESYEEIREPVQHQLARRVVDHGASAREARSEHAVVALVDLAMKVDDVHRIAGAVGHDDRHAVAAE